MQRQQHQKLAKFIWMVAKTRKDGEPGILRAGFRDVDDFNETVRGWNLEFRRLDCGPLNAGLTQYRTRHANFTSVHFSRVIAQTGAPPAGMRTFGVRQDRLPWMEWCGRDVTADSVLSFHPNTDFECLSPAGFAVFSLSFDESLLAQIAERLGHPDFLDYLNVEQVVDSADIDRLEGLREELRSGFSDQFMAYSDANPEVAREQFESRIAEDLVMLLTDVHTALPRDSMATRSRAVKTAVSYILERAHEPVSVGQVCEAANVSWRTLDRAFKEFLGMNPKACISAVRLHGARKDLIKSAAIANVADIANAWGYWHLGGFAKDYRRAFNELPSETLARRTSAA